MVEQVVCRCLIFVFAGMESREQLRLLKLKLVRL